MFRGMLLLLGLAILHTQAKHLLKQTDFTVEWYLKTKGSRFLPLVVKAQDELVFVSFPQYAMLTMKVESLPMTKTPCEIPLKVSNNGSAPSGIIKRPHKAIVLPNGKIVLSLLVANRSKVPMHEEMVKIYVVDRHTCSFNVTDLPVGVPRISKTVDVRVIEYNGKVAVMLRVAHNTFRLLLLDDTGKFLDSWTTSLPQESDKNWMISRVAKNDPSLGYIYTAQFDIEDKYRNIEEAESNYYHSFIMGDGSSIILTVQRTLAKNIRNETRPGFSSYIQFRDEDGEISEPIVFHKDIDADFRIDAFQVGKGGMCITASNLDRISIRCLDPQKEGLLNLL